MKTGGFFAKLVQETGRFLFPDDVTCHACGGELDGTTAHGLCADCKLEFNKHFCARCGQKIANMAEYCDRCIQHGEYHFDIARSAVVFNEPVRNLVHSFKYGGAQYLAEYFAKFMAETMVVNALAADILTFVPLHKRRRRKRGYNQSELLAAELAKLTNIPQKPLLKKIKHTKNLARMTRQERARAIDGTIALACGRQEVSDKSVLIVDDVLTTGATADECAKVLKAAGAARVTVLTFASVYVQSNRHQKAGKI